MTPIIGITADLTENRYRVSDLYAQAIQKAGGIPVILPPIHGFEAQFIDICDGFVFSGGDDPSMEQWGIATHPNAKPVSKRRQTFEVALLEMLQDYEHIPVLGVCLGMQWMGLVASGNLIQDLEEPMASHHRTGCHTISGTLGEGEVHTHHHQAISDSGNLEVIATADDGLIEAVSDPNKSWYVGVQWHPERTENKELGQGLFNTLISKAKISTALL